VFPIAGQQAITKHQFSSTNPSAQVAKKKKRKKIKRKEIHTMFCCSNFWIASEAAVRSRSSVVNNQTNGQRRWIR